ncbi:MAG: Eco57I restriction-modification methylase domain-containing protein [Bryobacteraceae bacterium]
MPADPTVLSHQEWLGYVQPVGVLVSVPALTKAGVTINRNFVPLHREFLQLLPTDRKSEPIPELRNFAAFATALLGWEPADLQTPPETLEHAIAGYPDVLRPTYVVRDGDIPILLIEEITSPDFDSDSASDGRHWNASPQMRFERLLRETKVGTGLLVSRQAIRLVYAPKGESSGYITFSIAEMVPVAGRPILAALHMLLSKERLFIGLPDQRLPALLLASRKYQNEVSTKLSRQVMEALFDLLRGFQAAHNQTNEALLVQVLLDDPNQVYRALLTVLLRMVFVLYAEDRDLLSADPLYSNYYSINGLFESLRADQGRYSDTMDSRYGAWARLLSLFRIIFYGARHGGLRIPGRKGYLFDPDRFPFLEGRADKNEKEARISRVSDGVLYRVLSKLLVLDGERLSYRSLDVEQIGSVYEAMMGFELHVAAGPSIAIKAKKKTGAPVTVNLKALLAIPSGKRNEWLGKSADQKVSGVAERDLKGAETVNDLMAALDKRIAKNITPTVVPRGAMIFQPSPERRRSGSHYTPRSLTAPIVEATLAPVLKKLGEQPKPEQILALKVCDPAMGSGAFLVEACRQLGDALSKAWHTHGVTPILPLDEDELLHARRLVAQRCLYGVDKNEMAVDLAKLSLWLATLARDHEFTFLNHALRQGDSLAGLSARQIAAFDWELEGSQSFLEKDLRDRIKRIADCRSEILSARDDAPYDLLSQKLASADERLELPRMAGDLVLSAFFNGDKTAARRNLLESLQADMQLYVERGHDELGLELDEKRLAMRNAEKPVVPFHWEIEFPEVFLPNAGLRAQGGFNAIVGNPPFAGKNTLIEGNADRYLDWLKVVHDESHGNSDLVAHFFRRSFDLLRQGGAFGLIATNTIGQGDTRSTGLRWICKHGGTIYRARKRRQWPGEAAVIISVVNVHKGLLQGPYSLDGRSVDRITAYLFHAGGHGDPETLVENANKSFEGFKIYGPGFTFDESGGDLASSLAEMKQLIRQNKANSARIFPYLGRMSRA